MKPKWKERIAAVVAVLREDPGATNAQVLERAPLANISAITQARRGYGYPIQALFATMRGVNRNWLLAEARRQQLGPGFVVDGIIDKMRTGAFEPKVKQLEWRKVNTHAGEQWACPEVDYRIPCNMPQRYVEKEMAEHQARHEAKVLSQLERIPE